MAAPADGGGVFLQDVRLVAEFVRIRRGWAARILTNSATEARRAVDGPVQVMVEFYGIPRQRAGRAELTVTARTVGDVLAAVERACPGLAGAVQPGGRS